MNKKVHQLKKTPNLKVIILRTICALDQIRHLISVIFVSFVAAIEKWDKHQGSCGSQSCALNLCLYHHHHQHPPHHHQTFI